MKKLACFAAALGCLPVLLLSSCFFSGMTSTVLSGYYDDAEDYQTGAFTYSADEVDSVEIEWYCGSVELTQVEGETLQVSESGDELTEERAMHWLLRDGLLRIRFCGSGYSGSFSSRDKRLTVELPQGLSLSVTTTSAGITASVGEQRDLTLRSTSGTVELTEAKIAEAAMLGTTSGGISAEKLEVGGDLEVQTTSGAVCIASLTVGDSAELGGTSGSIKLGTVTVADGELELESNSGQITVESVTAKRLTVGTTSGSVKLGLTDCREVDVETTSGSVRITPPTEFDATVTVRTTSGSINASGYRTEERGAYIWGDGACTVRIHTTSGSVTVK